MQASIYKHYGPPSVLSIADVSTPIPKENELLIRVHAATVNRTDVAMLTGKPFLMHFFLGLFKPRNPVLGTDFAGEVIETGKAVTRFKKGDRVFGFDHQGLSSHAEYLTISEESAINLIPEHITYPQATASIEGAHYAINMLNKVKIEQRDKVLVNGASGAIGSATVQLLKHKGIHVTAVTSGKNMEMIKALGPDVCINFEKQDFTQNKENYQFVFDTVGKSAYNLCKPILTSKGIYISSELGDWAQNIFYALLAPLSKGTKVIFPIPYKPQVSVDTIRDLLQSGDFSPLIDRTYTLNETSEAFTYVASGEKTGNVVIQITEP